MPKFPLPPQPISQLRGLFDTVFLTRPQLEAKIKALEKENTFLRKHSSTITASDGAAPCTQCAATSTLLRNVLNKYGAKSA